MSAVVILTLTDSLTEYMSFCFTWQVILMLKKLGKT